MHLIFLPSHPEIIPAWTPEFLPALTLEFLLASTPEFLLASTPEFHLGWHQEPPRQTCTQDYPRWCHWEGSPGPGYHFRNPWRVSPPKSHHPLRQCHPASSSRW